MTTPDTPAARLAAEPARRCSRCGATDDTALCLWPSGVHSFVTTAAPAAVVYADGRPESDPCEKGTPGCCVSHAATGLASDCECW